MVAFAWLVFGFFLALLTCFLLFGKKWTYLSIALGVVAISSTSASAQYFVAGGQESSTRSWLSVQFQEGSGLFYGNAGTAVTGAPTAVNWTSYYQIEGTAANGGNWPGGYDVNSAQFVYVQLDWYQGDGTGGTGGSGGYWQGTFWLEHVGGGTAGTPSSGSVDGSAVREVVIVYDSANDRHVELQGPCNATLHGSNGDSGASVYFPYAVDAATVGAAGGAGFTYYSPACFTTAGVNSSTQVGVMLYLAGSPMDGTAASATSQPTTQAATPSGIVDDLAADLLDANTGMLSNMQTRMVTDANKATLNQFGSLAGADTSFSPDNDWASASNDLIVFFNSFMDLSSHGSPEWIQKYFDSWGGFIQVVLQSWSNVVTTYAGLFSFLSPFVTLAFCAAVMIYTLKMFAWGFRWGESDNIVPPGIVGETLPLPALAG